MKTYSVTSNAIDAYRVLHNTHLDRDQIAHRIINGAKNADRSNKGKPFYPINIRTGNQNSLILVSDPNNPFIIVDVVTPQRAVDAYGYGQRVV